MKNNNNNLNNYIEFNETNNESKYITTEKGIFFEEKIDTKNFSDYYIKEK